jgi:hypothetical protein
MMLFSSLLGWLTASMAYDEKLAQVLAEYSGMALPS